jgi:hypothetical protein
VAADIVAEISNMIAGQAEGFIDNHVYEYENMYR